VNRRKQVCLNVSFFFTLYFNYKQLVTVKLITTPMYILIILPVKLKEQDKKY